MALVARVDAVNFFVTMGSPLNMSSSFMWLAELKFLDFTMKFIIKAMGMAKTQSLRISCKHSKPYRPPVVGDRPVRGASMSYCFCLKGCKALGIQVYK